MTERACAMQNVMMLGFALDDALLYLDTHCADKEALAYYQAQQEAYTAARESYIACFGPLQMDEVEGGWAHTWVETPWPWEGED